MKLIVFLTFTGVINTSGYYVCNCKGYLTYYKGYGFLSVTIDSVISHSLIPSVAFIQTLNLFNCRLSVSNAQC